MMPLATMRLLHGEELLSQKVKICVVNKRKERTPISVHFKFHGEMTQVLKDEIRETTKEAKIITTQNT